MPEAARLFEQPPVTAPSSDLDWSGELHGQVGAMHRTIEQRLLSGSFDLAVIPLPTRPFEAVLAHGSRIAGWAVLAATFAAAAVGILALVS